MNPLLMELTQESATTRRLLERLPEDRLEFRPHGTSMSLGQLALHVATIPGAMSGLAAQAAFDASNANFNPPQPDSKAAVLAAHDEGVAAATAYMSSLTPEQWMEQWSLLNHGNPVFTMPRVGMLRGFLMNHLIHHRGQLSVYLRMLEVPMPLIYGRSRDESPFG